MSSEALQRFIITVVIGSIALFLIDAAIGVDLVKQYGLIRSIVHNTSKAAFGAFLWTAITSNRK
ncbi:MAG: hypothetical protein WCT26_05010 [Candidatus Buchananbacteria bacterium]|jgi:hypothetical protein